MIPRKGSPGGSRPPQKQKYKDIRDRLLRLKTRLQNREIAVYNYAGAVAGSLKQCVMDFRPGDRLKAKRLDDDWYLAVVVESRIGLDGEREYFVHYVGQDRRLDEWMDKSRVEALSNSESADGLNKDILIGPQDSRLTRNQKRKYDEIHHIAQDDITSVDAITAQLEKEHQQITKVKYISRIQFGPYEVDAWYFSPYPDEYGKQTKLWICEFCLKYMRFDISYRHHFARCPHQHPPGTEIYRKDNLSVFEVDGLENKLYCQNLCLLAKLFLDHKTVYFDVSPFLFYVLCEVDRNAAHFVGYFSKEKESHENNNLACILILPHHQRKGFGKFLIAFSYELSRLEGVIGSPEKPLSDLGVVSYRSYWEWIIFNYIKDNHPMDCEEISRATCIHPSDVEKTLKRREMLRFARGETYLSYALPRVESYIENMEKRRPPSVDRSCLIWEPPVKKRSLSPKRL